jgi:hypothetical protein
MDLSFLFPWLLFLHVFGAMLAFGPTFTFATIGAMGGKEPQHANFAVRITVAISERFGYPLAILQGVTGVGLIITGKIDLLSTRWLLLGIVLYAIALTYALSIQRSAVHQVVELTSAPPPPDAPPGPPPALAAAIRQVQRGGMLLGILIVVIVFLMVVKPSF